MSRAHSTAARTQLAFREVNERIAELSGNGNETGVNLFICECGRVECAEALELTRAEYEAVRADDALFVVSPGHQQAGMERVIEANRRFLVVEMLGQAKQKSRRDNPRKKKQNPERKEENMATLVRWEPFRELASLQNEMSRFMNGFAEGNGQSAQGWVPTADVWETNDEVVYAFDLPGIPEDKVSVELEDGALTITGEREREHRAEDGKYFRFERRFGTFSRTIGLPQGVDEDGVTAKYEAGVLEVHVKKPEQPKPRKIEIGVGSGHKTIEGKVHKK